MAVLLQNDKLPCSSSSDVLDPLWIPISSPSFGAKSMVNFENVCGGDTKNRPIFQRLGKEETCDEDYDQCFHQPGKKRRLTIDQVQFLEKNFEVENKLEPERKIQLAKQLGLQPRQVAVWFQNRRARFKTKQLEKDYDELESCYKKLHSDYDNLVKEKEKLKDEVMLLKSKLNIKDEDLEQISWDKSSIQNSMLVCKEEDDSCNVLEIEKSEISQEDDDIVGKKVWQSPYLLKLEDECQFGFQFEDQPFVSGLTEFDPSNYANFNL